MSDAEPPAMSGAWVLAPTTPDIKADASTALEDPAATRAMHLERARKLGRRLQVQVSIDETGWLRSEIELVFSKEPDGRIRPVMVRVGRDASDDAVLAHGGVLAGCTQYNAALARLRDLAERLTTLVRQGRVALDPGSPVMYAHHELARLDELIAHRQEIRMGSGIVLLATLRREIEFFARCDAHLAPIVLAVERAANAGKPRDPARSRKLWRWPRWWFARTIANQYPRGSPELRPRNTP